MPKIVQIQLEPEKAFNDVSIANHLRSSGVSFAHFKIRKRSIDARGGKVRYQLAIECFSKEEILQDDVFEIQAQSVQNKPAIIIVGAGPAGYFAALEAIHLGYKPIVLERGKKVRERRRDLAQHTKNHIVNTESNYCYGEGGAGTYSDGKLYTRSDKRGDVGKVLDLFCFFGADDDIRINARPHIGTNKLPSIMEAMRQFIEENGGEIHFEKRVVDFIIEFDSIKGVKTADGTVFKENAVILATGHSADDMYRLLRDKGIYLERKPFALGVRAEHPQSLIDSIQYKRKERGEYLPPAYYSLVTQIGNKGVYSFCMCPGGIIAPCSTEPGTIVTNGWSPSKRNNPFANSGIVTEITLEDANGFEEYEGDPLALLHFRRAIEEKACQVAGSTQTAPAQKLTDFIKAKLSSILPDCSYTPGVLSSNLHEVLPPQISKRMALGFSDFGKKMKGYVTEEAILVAPESRTSSPVRIPRNKETYMHPQISGLFPCAEGAGYAGGIVSAAIDGAKCIQAAIAYLKQGEHASN